MILLIILFLIVSEALYESLYDNGSKTLSGVIEFIYRAAVTLVVLLWISNIQVFHPDYIPLWKLIVGYLLIRFALFDAVYNLTRKPRLPLFYVGDTKMFDKALGWFFRWSGINKEHFLGMFKVIALLCGTLGLILQLNT